MTTMTDDVRNDWMNGTAKQAEQISRAVMNGEYVCDECDAPATAIGHGGNGTPVNVRCAGCFLKAMEDMRRNRPSREELMARVNAAVGV